MNMQEWRDRSLHLPKFMRDFHDQKDLFKAIHDTYSHEKDPERGNNKVSWVDAHIYVIDIFLWFMASRGYTLQKSRTKVEFIDLHETIKQTREIRNDIFNKALGLTPINGNKHKKKKNSTSG